MKKIRELLKIAAALLAAFFCLTKTQLVGDAVYEAIMRCLTVVIPSLYGMMTISALLVKSGLTGKLPSPVKAVGRFVFGMNGRVFPIFLFSMLAGYPVGAKMLCAEAENGNITRRQAEIFSGVCCGAGPAFIFGCISSQLYGNNAAGQLILLSAVGANIILALVISLKTRKESSPAEKSGKVTLSSQLLTESILSGGRSIADICIMITAFAVITALLREIGIISAAARIMELCSGMDTEYCSGLFCAFLDVTASGLLPHGNYTILPLLCGLVSFGGVCVVMQISVLTSGRLNIRPFILLRIAAGIISTILCRLLMPLFLAGETVSAAEINVSAHYAPSPVPSFLLIIMTIVLLRQYRTTSDM